MQVRNEELECASNKKLEKYPKPKCVCMWLLAGMVVNILPQAHCSDLPSTLDRWSAVQYQPLWWQVVLIGCWPCHLLRVRDKSLQQTRGTVLTSHINNKVRATTGLAPTSQLTRRCATEPERTFWEQNGLIETTSSQGFFASDSKKDLNFLATYQLKIPPPCTVHQIQVCREEFNLFINFDMTTGINQLISTQSTTTLQSSCLGPKKSEYQLRFGGSTVRPDSLSHTLSVLPCEKIHQGTCSLLVQCKLYKSSKLVFSKLTTNRHQYAFQIGH